MSWQSFTMLAACKEKTPTLLTRWVLAGALKPFRCLQTLRHDMAVLLAHTFVTQDWS